MAGELRAKCRPARQLKAQCIIASIFEIVAWAGLLLAGALYMVDPLELLSSFVLPICFVPLTLTRPHLRQLRSALICGDLDCFTRTDVPRRIPICLTEADSFPSARRTAIPP